MTEEILKTTCPRDCYDGCRMTVKVEDGSVRRVAGDPDHALTGSAICPKCALAFNGVFLDPEARLLHPLRRTGPKGAGQYERVSWDDAITDIAAHLNGIIAQGSPQDIVYSHYTGTLSLIAFLFPYRLFLHMGATEVDPDTICNKAGHEALNLMTGDAFTGFDPRTAKDANVVVVWGGNPSVSAPHMQKNWLEAQDATVISIDPIRHGTAKSADIHLQPLPGSDSALAFGIMHILERDGALDDDFITKRTKGFDELKPEIAKATPDWTAAQTGVPLDELTRVAHLIGSGPTMFWLGQGLQRQQTGGNVYRSCAALAGVTGNIGKPGTGLLFINGPNTRGLDPEYLVAPQLIQSEPGSVSHMDLAETLENPKYKALVTWNNNPLASSPEQGRLRKAFAREDLFQVTLDIFPTDTTQFADYILPAASFLEFDDLISPYFSHSRLAAQTKAMAPLGEALPNQEIMRKLAHAMGYTAPELFESDADMIRALLDQAGCELTFEQLSAQGSIEVHTEPVVPFADGYATESGFLEFASDVAESQGLPRTPVANPACERQAGAFSLLSPSSNWNLNSSYDNDPKIRKRQGAPRVRIHPEDLESLGLENGKPVKLTNDVGSLQAEALADPDLPRGVLVLPKGRWPLLEGQVANVNALNAGLKSDIGASSAVHSTRVDVTAA